jgi:CRISPR-associated protein Cas2
VAKQCQKYGQRVQNSIFECLLEPAMLKNLQSRLGEIIDLEKDSLRYYYLGNDWRNRVEHVGAKASLDLEGTLIV